MLHEELFFYFASRHNHFIIHERLCEVIEPMWWEPILAGNGLAAPGKIIGEANLNTFSLP